MVSENYRLVANRGSLLRETQALASQAFVGMITDPCWKSRLFGGLRFFLMMELCKMHTFYKCP